MNVFEELGDVTWNDDPVVEIHEWRVRLPVARGAKALQVEFMRLDDPQHPACSVIVSVVDQEGHRGDEYVLGRHALKALRALLNVSDFSPLDNEKDETKDDG